MIARVLVGKSHTSNPTAQHVIESRFHDTVYDCGRDNPYNESSLLSITREVANHRQLVQHDGRNNIS
jgi:hypothetical protein